MTSDDLPFTVWVRPCHTYHVHETLSPDVVSLVGQRRRRWPPVKQHWAAVACSFSVSRLSTRGRACWSAWWAIKIIHGQQLKVHAFYECVQFIHYILHLIQDVNLRSCILIRVKNVLKFQVCFFVHFISGQWTINPFSAGIDFRRHNLTYTDVRFWRLKSIPALKE